MKYYLPEYLDISRADISQTEREEKNRQWEKACDEYEEYLKKHSKYFSKSFLEEYYKCGFHDYEIVKFDLAFDNAKSTINIVICLKANDNLYVFDHQDVRNYSTTIEHEKNCPFINDYLYGEYYKDDERLWHHNFLFGNYFETNITSKKFVFKKIHCGGL